MPDVAVACTTYFQSECSIAGEQIVSLCDLKVGSCATRGLFSETLLLQRASSKTCMMRPQPLTCTGPIPCWPKQGYCMISQPI
jgi:hypothetical protein